MSHHSALLRAAVRTRSVGSWALRIPGLHDDHCRALGPEVQTRRKTLFVQYGRENPVTRPLRTWSPSGQLPGRANVAPWLLPHKRFLGDHAEIRIYAWR